MPPPSAPASSRRSPADVLYSIAPLLVVLVWFAAGQWSAAGSASRAWLRLAGMLAAASLIPLPGRAASVADIAARARWWGWAAVAGLLVTS